MVAKGRAHSSSRRVRGDAQHHFRLYWVDRMFKWDDMTSVKKLHTPFFFLKKKKKLPRTVRETKAADAAGWCASWPVWATNKIVTTVLLCNSRQTGARNKCVLMLGSVSTTVTSSGPLVVPKPMDAAHNEYRLLWASRSTISDGSMWMSHTRTHKLREKTWFTHQD